MNRVDCGLKIAPQIFDEKKEKGENKFSDFNQVTIQMNITSFFASDGRLILARLACLALASSLPASQTAAPRARCVALPRTRGRLPLPAVADSTAWRSRLLRPN